ncbi:MAG: hypothetical protein HY330_05460 [Chloroflexi bacterium]|nr:hypothetical protein [Chloroflexota bacterium]
MLQWAPQAMLYFLLTLLFLAFGVFLAYRGVVSLRRRVYRSWWPGWLRAGPPEYTGRPATTKSVLDIMFGSFLIILTVLYLAAAIANR